MSRVTLSNGIWMESNALEPSTYMKNLFHMQLYFCLLKKAECDISGFGRNDILIFLNYFRRYLELFTLSNKNLECLHSSFRIFDYYQAFKQVSVSKYFNIYIYIYKLVCCGHHKTFFNINQLH